MLSESARPTLNPNRLAVLQATGLLDASASPHFDSLTRLVTAALRVPVALISLVDQDRQFFLSHSGLPEPWASKRETPLSHSFCQHVVDTAEPLIIDDARTHPLVQSNLAVRDLSVVAYAGVPIVDAETGMVLGSLCAIDTRPRQWGDDDVVLLRALSAQITAEIQLRAQSFALAGELTRQSRIEAVRRSTTRLNIHDLRTPLSALMLGMDVIEQLGPLNQDQKAYLDIAKRSGETLLNIINSLLDISMIDDHGAGALRRKAVHPCEAIAAAIEIVMPLAVEKKQHLTTPVVAALPDVLADADKLTRVLVNLIGNAIKFTPEGGRIKVGALRASDEARPAVVFSIEDTGIGVAEPERVFDEGVLLDNTATSRRSTGLGLTFCKRIVEAHGGRIWLTTALGAGSTFAFTLPTGA